MESVRSPREKKRVNSEESEGEEEGDDCCWCVNGATYIAGGTDPDLAQVNGEDGMGA